VTRMLIFIAAFSLSAICAEAELFVVKMNLRVKIVDGATDNLSVVTLTATNIIEAAGEDPTTTTLVLDSDNFGSILIVDNETGETLEDFASESTTGAACAINTIGTKQYCQAFLDLLGGTTASAVGPLDRRTDSATDSVLRYNWSAKIQGNLDAATYNLPSVSVSEPNVPFEGKFTSLKRFVPSGTPCTDPAATTGPAGNVGATTATVSASVNPNGLSTAVSFQYGLTIAYENSTSTQSAGSGTTTNVTAVISPLLPSQTYHYRVTASSSCGTVNGSDMTFTTTTNTLATSSFAQ
jgi:hypothetical protein